jgi:hypothetical protein
MAIPVPPCDQHPDGRPVATCPVCGKTVCSNCIRTYGYFCSEECRTAYGADEPGSGEADEHANREEAEALGRRLGAWLKNVFLVLVALVVAHVVMRFGVEVS